jgi:hypothetical protein
MADESDLDFKPRIDGPFRRNLGWIVAIAAILVIGPAISRVLKSYRGVLLETRDGEMLVALPDLPPRWMSAIDAQPGQIIDKPVWSWNPAPVPPRAEDAKLQDLYFRYTRTYAGVIVELLPPPSQGGTTAAVIQTDAGEQVVIKLVAEHLLGVREGDRVEKTINTWDPMVVQTAAEGPGATLSPNRSGTSPR